MSVLPEYLNLSVRNWINVILVSIVGAYLVQTFRSWYRLRHFKGPLLATLSRVWLVRVISGGRMHLDFLEVNRKYGTLARVGPNDLITSDPALIKRMSAIRSPYRRSNFYVGLRFNPSRDNIVSARDEEKHNELRTKMAAGYSGKENENLEEAVNRNIQALIDLIRTKYLSTDSKNKPLDFGRKAQYFTLDVISDLAYREPFGYMETDSDLYDYTKIVESVFVTVAMVTIFPVLNRVLNLSIMKAILPSDKDPFGIGKIQGITKKVVAQRFGPNKKVERDMLGSFVAHGLNQEDAESEIVIQITAGSDTTATAIRTTMLHLIMNPRITAKLRDEFSSNVISAPIKDSEARQLPYLQAVVKEGLRICPPIVGLLSKEVPAEGDIIEGRFVPGGTKIGWGIFGITRDKVVWGEDADQFRPERWLEVSREKFKDMESTLELVFGYGRYQCLGKNLAMMKLNKIFVELLRQFDFNIVNPLNPVRSMCHGIFFQSEMWLTAFERR
ncbi:pisatin demethylase [Stipitochalara longipes BDJ]|nr:pisatin demethylase [Stipitochalara longipes BDJ]